MYRINILLIVGAFFCGTFHMAAQVTDTLPQGGLEAERPVAYDTLFPLTFPDSNMLVPVREKGRFWTFFTKGYPNPRKAALFSFILPGAGQVYNNKWWKLPIVYGAFGTLIWLEVRNVREYRLARDNYRWIVDGDPLTQPEGKFEGRSAAAVRDYRDTFRRYVELTGLGIGITYFLTAADAFVDAHLARFDVSEDLSVRWRALETPSGPAVGLSMGITLDPKPVYRVKQYDFGVQP